MNQILTSTNTPLKLTGFIYAGAAANDSILGLPLGTSDGTVTGELGVKVLLVGGSLSAGGAGSVTQHITSVGASAAGTIPAGAKGWSVAFLTGTGTWGAVNVPAGFSDSSESTTVAAIAYTTNAASSAIVRYGT